METAVSVSSSLLSATRAKNGHFLQPKVKVSFPCKTSCDFFLSNSRRAKRKVLVRVDVSAALDPAPVEVTWQIVAGAIAGVMPFVVAGIEFSKRIIAQRRCAACGGSGLILREKDYSRCPECGGFLPWQSWKRFFSG